MADEKGKGVSAGTIALVGGAVVVGLVGYKLITAGISIKPGQRATLSFRWKNVGNQPTLALFRYDTKKGSKSGLAGLLNFMSMPSIETWDEGQWDNYPNGISPVTLEPDAESELLTIASDIIPADWTGYKVNVKLVGKIIGGDEVTIWATDGVYKVVV